MKKLNITTALPADARPLIDHYRCQLIEKHPWNIFANKDNSIHIIISGMGSINAASATSYLFAYTGAQPQQTFLNVGIAGHADLKIGELCLANKITDVVTGRSFFPQLPFKSKTKQAALLTHSNPATDYPTSKLLDMEAYGFFQAASQCVTQEQIAVLKIVSDNDVATQQQVNAKLARELITAAMPKVDEMVNQLLMLSDNEILSTNHQALLREIQQRWHFSHYQQQQLESLTRRWTIHADNESWKSICADCDNANQVLEKFSDYLDHVNYRWHEKKGERV